MRASSVAVFVIVNLAVFTCCTGCRSSSRNGREADPQRYSKLNELDWLSGAWVSEAEGLRTEEYWIAPRAGSMLGGSRTIKADQTAFFEHLRIAETPEGIIYYASPRGREATPFRLVELSENRVVFENPQNDFPQRILYWRDRRDGRNRLNARIEGHQRGQPASESWMYRRMR